MSNFWRWEEAEAEEAGLPIRLREAEAEGLADTNTSQARRSRPNPIPSGWVAEESPRQIRAIIRVAAAAIAPPLAKRPMEEEVEAIREPD